MFSLTKLFKKSDNHNFITLDIGAHAIKSVLFSGDLQTETLSMRAFAKELLEPDLVRAGVIIEYEKVIDHIKLCLDKLHETQDLEFNRCIVGIASSQTTNLTTAARIIRDPAKLIKPKELKAIETKIIDSALVTAQELLTEETGNSELDISLIATSKVYTKLNGNLVTNVLDQPGKDLEIALFSSFAPTFQTKILTNLAKDLQLEILAATPTLYTLTQALRKTHNNPFLDCMIIDIGHDTTDVGLVLGGGLIGAKSLNIGGHHFITQLSKATGLDYYSAKKKLYDFTFGSIDDSSAILVDQSLKSCVEIWLDGLELVFSEFNGVKTFPSEIFITGGTAKLPSIFELLNEFRWLKALPFKQNPTLHKLTADKFSFVTDPLVQLDTLEFASAVSLGMLYFEL